MEVIIAVTLILQKEFESWLQDVPLSLCLLPPSQMLRWSQQRESSSRNKILLEVCHRFKEAGGCTLPA